LNLHPIFSGFALIMNRLRVFASTADKTNQEPFCGRIDKNVSGFCGLNPITGVSLTEFIRVDSVIITTITRESRSCTGVLVNRE
jgi:hypothetical protein